MRAIVLSIKSLGILRENDQILQLMSYVVGGLRPVVLLQLGRTRWRGRRNQWGLAEGRHLDDLHGRWAAAAGAVLGYSWLNYFVNYCRCFDECAAAAAAAAGTDDGEEEELVLKPRRDVFINSIGSGMLLTCVLLTSFIWPVKSSPKWPIMCRWGR